MKLLDVSFSFFHSFTTQSHSIASRHLHSIRYTDPLPIIINNMPPLATRHTLRPPSPLPTPHSTQSNGHERRHAGNPRSHREQVVIARNQNPSINRQRHGISGAIRRGFQRNTPLIRVHRICAGFSIVRKKRTVECAVCTNVRNLRVVAPSLSMAQAVTGESVVAVKIPPTPT